MSGAEGGPGKRTGSNPGTAPRSDPYYTAVLSQQGGEAGGSLTREVPGRVASGPLCSRDVPAPSDGVGPASETKRCTRGTGA